MKLEMTKEELEKFYMQMPWFRHSKAEIYKTGENHIGMRNAYTLASRHGKLIEESNGQFTGGIRHELYEIPNGTTLHEFVFHGNDIIEFTVYDKEIYYNG